MLWQSQAKEAPAIPIDDAQAIPSGDAPAILGDGVSAASDVIAPVISGERRRSGDPRC